MMTKEKQMKTVFLDWIIATIFGLALGASIFYSL
jgi:hypothetical protein